MLAFAIFFKETFFYFCVPFLILFHMGLFLDEVYRRNLYERFIPEIPHNWKPTRLWLRRLKTELIVPEHPELLRFYCFETVKLDVKLTISRSAGSVPFPCYEPSVYSLWCQWALLNLMEYQDNNLFLLYVQ